MKNKPKKEHFATGSRLNTTVNSKFSSSQPSVKDVDDSTLKARRKSTIAHQAMNQSILQQRNDMMPDSMQVSSDSGIEEYESENFTDFVNERGNIGSKFSEKKTKNDPMVRKSRIHQTASRMSHKEMEQYLKEYEELSDNNESSHSNFIHFDETDRKGNFIHDRSVYGHDKLAESRIDDKAGGGATTTFAFKKNGELSANVKLNSYFKREDRRGFLHKSEDFIDSSRKFIDDFSPDDNAAAASNIDSKAEILLTHSAQKHRDKALRYKQISKVTKKEEKRLKQELKREDKEAAVKNVVKEQKSNTEGRQYRTGYFISENSYKESFPFLPVKSVDNDKEIVRVNSPFIENEEKQISEVGNIQKKEIISNFPEQVSRSQSFFTETEVLQLEDKSGTSQNQVADRFMTKNESLEQMSAKREATNKKKSKEVRRAAAAVALSNVIASKRALQNEIGDFSGNVSGDLLKDGSSGLLSVAVAGVKNTAKNLTVTIFRTFGSVAKSAFKKVAPIFLGLILIMGSFFCIFSSFTNAIAAVVGDSGDSGDGDTYNLSVSGNGGIYAFQSLSQETIDNYIAQLWENYPPAIEGDLNDVNAMNLSRERILRYALSKVGCAYDQNYHGNLNVDIFDCSSLAYRSYCEIGINISNGGNYCAAEECHAIDNQGKNVSSGNLMPGDLLFYSSSANGRYKNITHVAIYIGKLNINGTYVDKSVEALGTRWGVVVSDTRTSVVGIGRPIQ
ncbi:MAG: NlpC/P60 family protein [Lachnospiraceae bacterium]|nr:NlpC/P60 family protein [Lachnospiraceae bacterium]